MAGLCEGGNEPAGSLEAILISLAQTDQKEKKELVGSLVEKKVFTDGCTGRNGEREESSGQKKISDDRQH
ncbi:hypothetical protein ANN_09587 [Periplaneta americana]|uniref:Uncharacterized protein n=1 Tax=Periplaneta americana TaxID=6978 RepID=A0ABQ8TLS5_PERAM|nr:hypothetical protein ANN_09587 [Periplaneta americana]